MTIRNFQVTNLDRFEEWADDYASMANGLLTELDEFAENPGLGTEVAAHCDAQDCEVTVYLVPSRPILRGVSSPWFVILIDRFAKTLQILEIQDSYYESKGFWSGLQKRAQDAIQSLIAREKYYGS